MVLALFAGAVGSVAAEEAERHSVEVEATSDALSREWLQRTYGYFARNESLRSLLFDFAGSIGIPTVISPAVNGVVIGSQREATVLEFLTRISDEFDLVWMFDGATLYIYDTNEVAQSELELPVGLQTTFRRYMEELELVGTGLRWTMLPTQNLIQIVGPPRFIELAEGVGERARNAAAVERAPAPPGEPAPFASDDYVIRFFPIGYSFINSGAAAGTAFDLAEMVGNLMNVPVATGVAGVVADSGAGSALKGTGLSRTGEEEAVPPDTAQPVTRDSEAYVAANPRLNALIVRDLNGRMPTYEQLIRDLDKPLDQIEIEVSILDIDASEALSLDIGLQSREVQFSAGGVAGTSGTVIYDTTLDAEEFSGMILRLRALQDRGKSRILSQPSIMTLDNHTATFRNDSTFYVRLGGNLADTVDLVPVTYGETVSIRPHIIQEGDRRKILMELTIQDGRRKGAASDVTDVPEVAENAIVTNAIVDEGESLLIGGYRVRERTTTRSRVPLLGRIPFVGALFGSTSDVDIAIARYFVIAPRIVPASISYTVNTGFEDEEREAFDAVVPKLPHRGDGRSTGAPAGQRPPGSPSGGARTPARDEAAEPEHYGPDPSRDSQSVAAQDGVSETDVRFDRDAGSLLALSSDHLAVQGGAFSTLEAAERRIAAWGEQPQYRARALIRGRPLHVLVWGVYPSKQGAEARLEEIARRRGATDLWIRNVGSLQRAVQAFAALPDSERSASRFAVRQ